MISRKGTLLERNVEQLLKLSGFKPEVNKIYSGYEIDVFLRYENLKIGFECKQYERGSLAIRNLIHEWDSKNKELKFDKIILVLVGCDISIKDYQLAKKYGIIIWDEPKLISLLDGAIEKKVDNKNRILKELGIKTKDIKVIEEKETEIEQTIQQLMIKETLEKIMKRNIKGIQRFKEKGMDFFIDFEFSENGFLIPLSNTDEIKKLLVSLEFKEIPTKRLYGKTIPEKNIDDLKEKEFIVDDDVVFTNCGNDTNFVAYLIDRIFRDIFKADDNYELKFKQVF